jgi:hypothetical protein
VDGVEALRRLRTDARTAAILEARTA